MEYLLSILFLALHLFNYQFPLPKAVFFCAGLFLFCALFYTCFRKTKDFFCTCLMMFCHTWQSSWVNIFGDIGTPLQITWFYLTGAIVLLYAVFDAKSLLKKKVPPVPLALFAAMFVFIFYPQIISVSQTEGMKEFLIIAFFLVMGFISFLYKDRIPAEKRRYIVNAYIFCVVVSCVLLLFQYGFYHLTGRTIFRYSVGVYNGKALTSSKLLMDDTSCSVIMLGGAVFYLTERLNKRNWAVILFLSAVILAGMGTTSRRTPIVSLALILMAYVILHYRGMVKKITMSIIAVGMMAVMFMYLNYSRSVASLDSLLYDNGRMALYSKSIELFFKYPLGMGYDNAHLAYEMGGIVPHNTMLRWLNMGGIVFGVLMAAILIYIFYEAYKRSIKTEMWFILYCVFASNLIPDILNARLFVLPVMMTFLIMSKEENITNEEDSALQSRNQL